MELIMIMESTNLNKHIKVSYCYRWSLDRGLVFIWLGADREFVVTLKALFVLQWNSACP